MEQEGLFLFRLGDAGQAKLAAIAKVQPHLHHQDGAKALQGAGRGDGLGHHFKLHGLTPEGVGITGSRLVRSR